MRLLGPGARLDRHAFLLASLAAALLIGQLPLVLAACCAPPGAAGLGTVWFVNDFAQYESAMRQGAQQSGWLIRDLFTAEAHAPAFMFPFYVGLGKLAAVVHLPAEGIERVVEVLARTGFVVALWRFATTFAHSLAAARAAFLLALFGGGLALPVLLVGGLIGASDGYAGSWAYETSSFGLLLAAPHATLAAAITLEIATRWLRPAVAVSAADLVLAGLLGAALALLHPFHVPLLLVTLGSAGLVWWRAGQRPSALLAAIGAGIGALPVLVPTVLTFSTDPFWSATYTTQNILPTPLPHALFLDLGMTLLLALTGVALLRGNVAPFGLVLWLLFAVLVMYLPVPYQRRLVFGVHPALAVLAGNGLVAAAALLSTRAAAALRLGVAALAGGASVLVVVSVVASGLSNAPLPVYRSTTDLDAAARWLDQHAGPGEVVLGDWDVGNYLAPRAGGASSYGGHPVATLNASDKRFFIATLFAHSGDAGLARRLGAHWLVYGPAESELDGPAGSPAFQSGQVRVYRVQAGA